MKRPVISFLIFYLSGILIFEFFQINLFLICLILFIFYYIFHRNGIRKTIIFLFLFLWGIFFAYIFSASSNYENQEFDYISGKFTAIREGESVNLYRLTISKLDGKYVNFKVIFKSRKIYPVDAKFICKGKFLKVGGYRNFKTFNNENYMKTQGVFLELDAKDIRVDTDLKMSIKNRIFSYLSDRLDKNFSPRASSFIGAMLLNKKDGFEDFDLFKDLGLAHILSISGLHINIILKILEVIGYNLSFDRKKYSVFIISILFFYAYVIDFPVSIMRAIFMYGIETYAIYANKRTDKLNTIFLSMFSVLLLNPFYIYSPAFYFSFASIFSIFYIKDRLREIFRRIDDGLLFLFALQIGLLPIQFYYYNQLNLLSLLANVLLVSLIEYILGLGIFALALPLNPILFLIDSILTYVFMTVSILSNISFFTINFPSPSIGQFFIYYAILLGILNLKRIYTFIEKKALNNFIIILTASLLSLSFMQKPRIVVNFIDVGQGDAILIRSKNYNIMIDTGGNFLAKENSGKNLYDYLVKNSVKDLDYVFLSHKDYDHIGNLFYLQERMNIGEIYLNSRDYSGNRVFEKGSCMDFDELRLCSILDGKGAMTSNDSSNVILAKIFNSTILFTGDVEENEKRIKIPFTVDFLKVSHHGSRFSTSAEFLNNNSFRKAIISAGRANSYGHPHKSVLERLKDKDIDVYRTDTGGNIEVVFYEGGYMIYSYGDKIDLFYSFIKLFEVLFS
ncbi:DNA internalization-related competence protein ComEC/Rec2 [Peptoniphilaceae bacterium SGI.131]